MTAAESRAKVLGFLAANPGLFAAVEDGDGRGAQLLERMTGKQLALRWDELAECVEKSSPLRPHPYLVLVFRDGRQVVLADVGFAFAPSIRNTGPLPELPATFCFRDLRHLVSGAHSYLEEEGRELEALRAVMVCIALLDGAREAGFEVSRDERAVDALLQALEQRGVRA